MKIQSFKIDTSDMTASLSATDQGSGIIISVQRIKIHGHGDKKLDELNAHAREEARRALRAAADAL